MDLDISMEQSIKQGTLIPEITTDKVAVVSLVGRRDKNEDRYMVSVEERKKGKSGNFSH